MTLFENINNARQQLTNSDTDQYVLNSIGYNIGCIANMLKGICNNTASALTSLEGDMKNEVVCLLRLYLDTYPLTVSSHGSYLLYQLDGLIHRLVIVLKEDMSVFIHSIHCVDLPIQLIFASYSPRFIPIVLWKLAIPLSTRSMHPTNQSKICILIHSYIISLNAVVKTMKVMKK